MNYDEAEVRSRVSDRRISAITLDTSVFDKLKNGFEHGLLARMVQFRGTDIQVVISDVVAGEVRRHVIRDASAAETSFKAGLKSLGGSWALSREARSTLIAQAMAGETVEVMAERRFAAFRTSVDAEVIDSGERVDTRRLLRDYFGSVAPFGATAAKKSEFPDAIALQALEHWAQERDTEMLVVSADGDWQNFCSTSERLVCVSELATALAHFHQDASLARVRISRRIASGEIDVGEALSTAIGFAAEGIDFIPDGNAAYRFEAEIASIEAVDDALVYGVDGVPQLTIVDSDLESITLEAEAIVVLSVTASFSFSTTDPVDRDEMRIGSCSASKQIEKTAKLLLTFSLAGDGDDLLEDVEATFEGGTEWVDYGEVEPGWVGDDS